MTYDRTLIVIRERSFLELLDLALVVIRARPAALTLAAVTGIAPFAAFNAWLLSDLEFPRIAWMMLLIVEMPCATAPITLVLGDLMFEVRPRVRRGLSTMAAAFPTFFVTQVLLRGLLLVFVIGFLLVPSRFCFLSEVVLLERVKTGRALRRCLGICRGYEGELFMRSLGQSVLGLTFAICFRNGMESVLSVMGGGELTWDQPGLADMGGGLFQLGLWIAIAYFAVVRFLSYIDRRIRLEGWEIELRLKGVGRALEEKPR